MLSVLAMAGILFPLRTNAQEPPVFEAASVKPASPQNTGRGSVRGGPGTSDPTQITFTNVTLATVFLRAWDLKSWQLSAPDWVSSKRYDIIAKLRSGTSKEQLAEMLRNLLADRFQARTHPETRNIEGYEIVPGKNGLKIRTAKPADSANQPPPGPDSAPKIDANGFPILSQPGLVLMEGRKGRSVVSFVTAKAQPLSALADFLSGEFHEPILDSTRLTGLFDFTLEFAPEAPGAVSASPRGVEDLNDAAPNLLTALPQQLGLQLQPGKIPTRVVVVDAAQQTPTEN
jgi:uncharacterized protein (TIGR03435 family)